MKSNLRYCGLLLVLMLGWLPSEAKSMAVVVDKANATSNLTAIDLIKILQASNRKWPDGKNVTVVMRDPNSPEMQQFLQRLYKMSPDEVKTFLASHKGTFVTAESDEILIKLVESTPGAVGLVDVYSITSHINVLKVDGKLPLEQGYALH
jgi:ABC-type phosphate transport system substrate-binding protein